jgi:hypothetical protein
MPNPMTQQNFNASMRLMTQVKASCVALRPIGELRTDEDLATRARIVRAALNARSLLQGIHMRGVELNAALARFHARKQRIAGDTSIDVKSLRGWLKCERT